MRTTGVTDQQLDSEIDERDFYMLGKNIETITGFLERLNLTPSEQTDVRRIVDRGRHPCWSCSCLETMARCESFQSYFPNIGRNFGESKKRSFC